MFRRWFIRSCFSLPILLSIVGWGWSVGQSATVRYYHAGYVVACTTNWGVVRLWGGATDPRETWWPGPLSKVVYTPPLAHFLIPNDSHYFLGFGYLSRSDYHFASIPYWFLIIVFSLALFFVWRKTRMPNPATAFPVEVKASGKES